jgi:hypothetical protein
VVKLATVAGGGDRAWPTSDDGHHWNHWRREVLAYQSGFADRVYADAGLSAPRMLAAVEPRPGVVALWLEDVAGRPGARWPVGRLAEFAERLGRAQAGRTGREPAHPWLSRRWLRQYVASKPITEPVRWDHPEASAVWPAEVRAGLRRLWERRDELLALAEALPQTTCHLDVCWPGCAPAAGAAGTPRCGGPSRSPGRPSTAGWPR